MQTWLWLAVFLDLQSEYEHRISGTNALKQTRRKRRQKHVKTQTSPFAVSDFFPSKDHLWFTVKLHVAAKPKPLIQFQLDFNLLSVCCFNHLILSFLFKMYFSVIFFEDGDVCMMEIFSTMFLWHWLSGLSWRIPNDFIDSHRWSRTSHIKVWLTVTFLSYLHDLHVLWFIFQFQRMILMFFYGQTLLSLLQKQVKQGKYWTCDISALRAEGCSLGSVISFTLLPLLLCCFFCPTLHPIIFLIPTCIWTNGIKEKIDSNLV